MPTETAELHAADERADADKRRADLEIEQQKERRSTLIASLERAQRAKDDTEIPATLVALSDAEARLTRANETRSEAIRRGQKARMRLEAVRLSAKVRARRETTNATAGDLEDLTNKVRVARSETSRLADERRRLEDACNSADYREATEARALLAGLTEFERKATSSLLTAQLAEAEAQAARCSLQVDEAKAAAARAKPALDAAQAKFDERTRAVGAARAKHEHALERTTRLRSAAAQAARRTK